MSVRAPRLVCGTAVLLLGALLMPAEVRAQGEFGAGPRFSFIRGSDAKSIDQPRTRLSGGMARLRTSERTALEIAFDYRSHMNDDLTQRIKDMPIQGSLLMYLVNASVSPYILGGMGWYSQKVEHMAGNAVRETTSSRRVGYHAGVGAQIQVHRRAAVHVDYRYTFIHFGDQPPGTTEPGAIPIPGLVALQDRLNLSHEASMWTTGLTFFF
ncbi:MAG: porin family protein [Acidobacteria bacterium]|nr:porin family protein [Acidobacteriota bacterium]